MFLHNMTVMNVRCWHSTYHSVGLFAYGKEEYAWRHSARGGMFLYKLSRQHDSWNANELSQPRSAARIAFGATSSFITNFVRQIL